MSARTRGGLAAGLLALAAALLPAPVAAAADFPGCFAREGSTVPLNRMAALSRGFNVPDWVEAPETRTPDPVVLDHLQLLGMRHIRLPVNGELVMPRFASEAETALTLESLRTVLARLTANGWAASVDLHPGRRFSELHVGEPDAAEAEIATAWTRLAGVIRDFPADAVFAELLNEPSAGEAVWAEQMPRLAAHLRSVLPEHTLIVGPSGAQRIDQLVRMQPLEDPNVVYAVHYYDPMPFTHQGLTWAPPGDPLAPLAAVPFPATRSDPAVVSQIEALTAQGHQRSADLLDRTLTIDWNAAMVAREFALLSEWSRKAGRPTLVNEFGVLRFVANPSDRARWLAAVVDAAETNCTAWTHWDFSDGFGLLDDLTRLPDSLIIRALFDPASVSGAGDGL